MVVVSVLVCPYLGTSGRKQTCRILYLHVRISPPCVRVTGADSDDCVVQKLDVDVLKFCWSSGGCWCPLCGGVWLIRVPRLSSVYGLRPVHRVLGLHLVYIARVASIQFQLAAPMVGRNRSGDLLRHFLVAGSVRRVHRVTCLHQVYIGSI